MIGIIGGTGVAPVLKRGKEVVINTRYGKARVLIDREDDVVLLFRHGLNHSIPPHRINYRANIYALKMIGVERILAINSVGSLKEHIKPGTFFLPQDFMEFTKSRVSTYYDGEDGKVVHIDLSEPYCPEVLGILREILDRRGYSYSEGVYICTEGPRFETKAEIRFYKTLGDVVGMTGYPEVVLAKELGLCYVSLCTVTNYAAGISKDRLT
ncbi:MAG TPA: S-methyl-5'-thioadenosine phosphorylase, partial [Methanothermococcus okinawensis]|nr:S-methyl-5'-thioadenosine phosphorylase [Methanothermococcus okinawensis]